jgi:hypothetical protein
MYLVKKEKFEGFSRTFIDSFVNKKMILEKLIYLRKRNLLFFE